MKTCILTIIAISLNIATTLSQESKPEIFIIGTMHDVPKIVKHSYRPLLKIATSYAPDAIYVERQRPEDSLSLKNYESQWFLPYGDSIRTFFKNDIQRTIRLKKASIRSMKKEDFEYLKNYYAVHRDKANWYYYAYLTRYGLNGNKKPVRNENGDLTAKLAIAMDMNFIYAMDHQHETKEYTNLSRACIKQSNIDGEVAHLKKQNKKEYRLAIIPALLGRLGHFTNKQKTVRGYEISNRFTFRKTACTPCIEAAAVWDRRNAGMAKKYWRTSFKIRSSKSDSHCWSWTSFGTSKSIRTTIP